MEKNEISIKKALRIGTIYVLYVFWIVVFICFFWGIIIPISLFGENSGKTVIMMGIMWLIPFIYFYFASRVWQFWAFKRVKDVHTLRTIALEEKIMWMGEINHKNNNSKIAEKFAGKDLFVDDINIPESITIKASKFKEYSVLIISGLLFLGLIITGIIYLFKGNEIRNSFLLLMTGISFFYLFYRQYQLLFVKNKNGEIVFFISNKGIQLSSSNISYYWDQIKNEKVFVEAKGRYNGYYLLKFDYLGEEKMIDISHWIKNVHKMEYLLEIYRGRFERDNLEKLKETKFAHKKGTPPISYYKKERSLAFNIFIIIMFMVVFLAILSFSVVMSDRLGWIS